VFIAGLVTVPVVGIRRVLVAGRYRVVLVLVALGEVEPDPQCHEQDGNHQDERDRRSGNDREYRPEESDRHRGCEVDHGRQGGAEGECDDEVHRPGDSALHGREPGGIRQRDGPVAGILSAMGRWQACPRGRTSAGPVRGCHPARLPRRGAVFLCVVSEFRMRVRNRGGGAPPTAMGSRCRAAVWRSAFRRRTGLRRPDQPALRRFSATTSSAHNPTTGECDRCREVGPVGLEPTTHGLRVCRLCEPSVSKSNKLDLSGNSMHLDPGRFHRIANNCAHSTRKSAGVMCLRT
jgi:hypothetical protein